MLMMEPPRAPSTIALPNTWQARNTLVKSMFRMRCHSASVISKNGVPEFTPAAFTRISTWPKRARTAVRACSRLVLLVASQHTPMAAHPSAWMDCARASAPSLLTSRMATPAPAFASPVAIAPAMTPPPPMTTAAWPVSEKIPFSAIGFDGIRAQCLKTSTPHQRRMNHSGDRLGQRSRVLGTRHGQRLPAHQAMTRHAEEFQETALPAQRELRQDRVAEAGLHQALDGFGIVGLHDHSGRNAEFAEKGVDAQPHVAPVRIKQKLGVAQLF